MLTCASQAPSICSFKDMMGSDPQSHVYMAGCAILGLHIRSQLHYYYLLVHQQVESQVLTAKGELSARP